MKYEIAGETFTSQDAIRERCKEIRDADTPIEGQAHAFLLALLGRHPESDLKIGVGVRQFTVRVNDEYRTKGFWLERLDGTKTDWSFVVCVAPPTHKSEVMKAFRRLIAPQIQNFRARAYEGRTTLPCAITGVIVPFAESHVDHQPPDHFDALAQRFIDACGLTVEKIAVMPTEDGVTFNMLVDDDLGRRWIEYHAQHAKLRITSGPANLKQGTGK
jgi:hypothetical protein